MCDCEDSSDFSDDQNRPMYAPYESKKLKKLNFSNYDTYDINEKKIECAIFLIDFDVEKILVVSQDDSIYQIFNDGKPFRVAKKTFSGIIKRSKVFAGEKKTKVKDPMVSKQLWEVMCRIIQLIRIEEMKKIKNILTSYSHFAFILSLTKELH